eukprot:Colp12_sorted_trinity150504_noHs@25349
MHADKIHQVLDRAHQDKTSVVIHSFSGSSSAYFPLLVKRLKEKTSKGPGPVVAGLVFDSGPAAFNRQSGLAAASTLLRKGHINYPMYMAAVAAGVTVDFFLGHRRRSALKEALKERIFVDAPQLYLYSSDDHIVPPDVVEAAIAHMKEHNASIIHSKRWQKSEHVNHFAHHEDEYAELLTTFLRRECLVALDNSSTPHGMT